MISGNKIPFKVKNLDVLKLTELNKKITIYE
jgi:hypothetical protein